MNCSCNGSNKPAARTHLAKHFSQLSARDRERRRSSWQRTSSSAKCEVVKGVVQHSERPTPPPGPRQALEGCRGQAGSRWWHPRAGRSFYSRWPSGPDQSEPRTWPQPRCRSDQSLRSSQARSDPGFPEFYSDQPLYTHCLRHSVDMPPWGELGRIGFSFRLRSVGLPAHARERASGLQGPIAPSANHEVSPVADCLLPFMVRPRAPSERPWRCGRPSFPTARRDSLSSPSDNFP